MEFQTASWLHLFNIAVHDRSTRAKLLPKEDPSDRLGPDPQKGPKENTPAFGLNALQYLTVSCCVPFDECFQFVLTWYPWLLKEASCNECMLGCRCTSAHKGCR